MSRAKVGKWEGKKGTTESPGVYTGLIDTQVSTGKLQPWLWVQIQSIRPVPGGSSLIHAKDFNESLQQIMRQRLEVVRGG